MALLPSPLVSLLWTLIAVLWPAVQSLHAVRTASAERKLWLFYWLCLVAVLELDRWLGFLLRLPLWVASFVVGDLSGEIGILVASYLVLPRFMGIQQLQLLLLNKCGEVMTLLLSQVTEKLAASLPSHSSAVGEQKAFADRPGKYTVIKVAGLMPTKETAKGSVMSQINIGEVINVLEVVQIEEQVRRVRGRIESPEGWITLLNLDNGTRWAVHEDDAPAMPGTGVLPQANEVFANAAAAGCNPTALFQGMSGAIAAPTGEVSAEDAWEAMALLESQLARADDFSEDAPTRQASGMLRQMLTTLTQTGNPAMLSMAQAMMPDLGMIWANESTREYLKDLLAATPESGSTGTTAGPGGSSSAGSTSAVGSSSGGSGSSGGSTGSGSGSGSAGSTGSGSAGGASSS